MSFMSYKGLIRGAFALTVSFLEKSTYVYSRVELENLVQQYLKDNGLDISKFKDPRNRDYLKIIVQSGESVFYNNKSMDEALKDLGEKLTLYL